MFRLKEKKNKKFLDRVCKSRFLKWKEDYEKDSKSVVLYLVFYLKGEV